MTDKKRILHEALVTRILEGNGGALHADRRAAFDNTNLSGPLKNLVEKVAMRPTTITDEDIAAVKVSGWSEDQIFELVICSAIGQATRQYDAALNALDEAVKDTTIA
jgi:hypothetical protein